MHRNESFCTEMSHFAPKWVILHSNWIICHFFSQKCYLLHGEIISKVQKVSRFCTQMRKIGIFFRHSCAQDSAKKLFVPVFWVFCWVSQFFLDKKTGWGKKGDYYTDLVEELCKFVTNCLTVNFWDNWCYKSLCMQK